MGKERESSADIMTKEERDAIGEVFEEIRRNSSYKSNYVPRFLKSTKTRHLESAKAKTVRRGRKK